MNPKPFPWRCAECGKREVEPTKVLDYTVELKHDGRRYDVRVPTLEAPVCGACKAVHIDLQADDQVWAALRQQLRLLSPQSIRSWREERLGLTQKEFAARLGVAPETVCRWESGALIQSRAYDNLMRLFFGMPEVRDALLDPDCHLRELAFVEDRQVLGKSVGAPFELELPTNSAISYEIVGPLSIQAIGNLAA